MKRAGFPFCILNILVLTGWAADVQLYAQWPLTNSLFNSAGTVSLDPYGGGSRLSHDAVSYRDGAVELGDIALFGTPLLDSAEGITITGWIKPGKIEEGFSGTAPHTLIFFYDVADRNGTQFVCRILDGKLGVFNATPAKNVFSSFSAVEGEWSFFAFVLKKNAVDIYLNRYPPQTTGISSALRYNRIYIGALNTDLLRPYRGLMKNVRLYKGALGIKDIRDICEEESD